MIAKIRQMTWQRARSARQAVVAGIGDDCAVLRTESGLDTLVTSDFSLENVHFRCDWHSPDSVGQRCAARGLSDIAAMGGTPVAIFLSLALPAELPQRWVDRFIRGLTALAQRHGAGLAGGDTAQSSAGILADILVVGTVPKGRAILRSGARPGDLIFVSGELGGSAAAVHEMEKRQSKVNPKHYRQHFYPEPRIELGNALREAGLASAMIDTSDGLSTDLAHICDESHVGAEINIAALPLARVGFPLRQVGVHEALHGGEDYELLFTVPSIVASATRRRSMKKIPQKFAGVRLTEIGRITAKRGMLLRNPDGKLQKLSPHGWEHFHKRQAN
ncbi:MAG TPA: thiamine-phosphate kinase [Candidatus Sulfotelmatobacter sp.]|nr:thiamine-phosphate kinase [Candidatus Sulfotelmatobacter sp.]